MVDFASSAKVTFSFVMVSPAVSRISSFFVVDSLTVTLFTLPSKLKIMFTFECVSSVRFAPTGRFRFVNDVPVSLTGAAVAKGSCRLPRTLQDRASL